MQNKLELEEVFFVVQINAELKTMFGRLYKLAELCGEMNMAIQKPEIIRPVYCGSLQIVVVDALWNHIASDGMVQKSLSPVSLEESAS